MGSTTREPFAVEADLVLHAGTDPRAPGGQVTVALCGHWEHEGACRWPHNTSIDGDAVPARLRTVVVVRDDERAEVESRIEGALHGDDRWSVTGFAVGAIRPDEAALAGRLGEVACD
ncbi:MAG: hypothetical protein QOJ71_276 [Actinomycetota bacterium]|jgi:hypothetical protein|nr:hypothetical protein [Actinomycetota bacterium]